MYFVRWAVFTINKTTDFPVLERFIDIIKLSEYACLHGDLFLLRRGGQVLKGGTNQNCSQ